MGGDSPVDLSKAARECDPIAEYLQAGGLFNPETMDHDRVRDLLMWAQSKLAERDATVAELRIKLADVEAMHVKLGSNVMEPFQASVALGDAKREIERLRTNCETTQTLKAAWEKRAYEAEARESELRAEVERLKAAQTWRPMETAPSGDVRAFWWVVPKLSHEAYVDTSGRPVTSNHEPYRYDGKRYAWGALSKAVAWMPLPAPPTREQP